MFLRIVVFLRCQTSLSTGLGKEGKKVKERERRKRICMYGNGSEQGGGARQLHI